MTESAACILAVDDSAAMRQILSAALAAAGYRVTTARDGQEALDKARALRFDLVLTDQHMPGMDGLALIRGLRALASYAAVPVLVLTTEEGAEYRQAAQAAGATGRLLKPVDPSALVTVVDTLLHRVAARQPMHQ